MKCIAKEIYHDVIECLVGALEAKDLYVSGHSNRVADMSYDLARKIGIQGKELEDIHIAAHLHDIGKIGVPDHILNKTEKLTMDEWLCIKKHPEMGYNILNRSDSLKDIANIVLYHHERWDGKGYCKGLTGEHIPLGSRVIAICDAIDAMTSSRSYRSAFSWEKCKQEVEINKGLQFDPYLVEEIGNLWDSWERLSKRTNKNLMDHLNI
ncbi:HD-GYP domain-containing protein [Geosporobacter ferrireducens]|uniref:Phosphohydrolase n=1 Tax=Geosporobacter ferrireducens TaxID=1424294 RepID=A0A1D8GIV0_9FIRM|nr:HD-GYP domain-containing protein [Geosporobacter ferrireducens]AOT70818.1 phosphohydrolase [Geosporobacter ferrireducens]MTI53519.1 HD-GYP domain-containing protein [Geosporobacter ferrireducens]